MADGSMPPIITAKQLVQRTRARTTSATRIAKRDLEMGAIMYPMREYRKHKRPRIRQDCMPGGINEARPCPWAGCAYHLKLDVAPNGSIKDNVPDIEIEQMEHTCALDLASQGGMTLEDIGSILNLTRERIRQLEGKMFAKLRKTAIMQQLETDYGVDPESGVGDGNRAISRSNHDEPNGDIP